jgi:hypothetical protein
MHIHCRGNPYTEQLPSDSSGIVDVSTDHYQATHVPSHDHCIETAMHARILFEKQVVIRTSGPKKEDVTEECGKLHGEEFHNLYVSPTIVRVIK